MNRRRKFLLASVLAVQNSSFIYPSCQKCFSRIILVSKRYIENPNEILETLDSDTTQNLLTKAVETCFIGQNFIFGVTNFENRGGQDSESSNFIQQRPDCKREVKALVACQIILPDPGVAGFTVIDYFHQLLRPSNFRKLYCGSQASNSYLLTLGHSDSDLSSICGSDSSSCFLEFHDRDSSSRFWQPALELTSVVSHLTDDDFSASEQSKAIGTLHQNRKCNSFAEATSCNSCHDPIQGSWSLVSYMDKQSKTENLDEELGLQTNQLSAHHSTYNKIRVTDSNLFPFKMQKLLELSSAKYFHSAEEIKNRYSQPELACHQHHNIDTLPSIQERSEQPPSLRLEAGGSLDCDPEIWDDLPFSESLNKFLEVIESETALTQTDASSRKCYLSNDIGKLHADHSRLSLTLQRTGALHTPPIALRSSQATVKTNSSKDYFLPSWKVNPSPGAEKESQSENTAETVSVHSKGNEISEYFLPNAYLSPLFPSSKDLQITRTQPHRTEISPRCSTSKRNHYCLSIKYLNGCGEKSLSEMSEKLTAFCSKKYNDVSDLCSLENKEYYRWLKNQDDSFSVCRELTYSLESICNSPNKLKEMPYGLVSNNLTQSFSVGHEEGSSYNASADLFDVSAKEVNTATEIIKKSQDILLQWETTLAESHPAKSDFSLRSLPENSNLFSQKLSLQNISATMYPKTCSSPPHFQSDSEYDFVDSQDFVPYSQSTPVARFHQTRIHGMKHAFKTLPVFYSAFDASYKKSRISSENDTQQATPSCAKNKKTLSQRSRSPIACSVTQPEVFNHCPIAKCLETDVDEWVPPTSKKVFLSDMPGSPALGLRKCLAVCNSPDQKELPRKKLKHDKQRTDKCLIKKELNNMLTAVKQKTPKYSCKTSNWISKESVSGFGGCSKVKCLPFSKNWPSSVPETESAWSPELFS
ncbi:DNA damage-induced apoptosis suppressor protein isoform X2 [Choloepus didactylus]|uniref:DNA damage-induced apoptosis suppressor protein isoform X2 n=1 Tax=Choloepus didactylus TaxID=27675 RepID=UPI00189FABBB|nr:DNA damage-induced apoptosis suppressor protein isoform X2 [Choloepus didactylus]